MIIHINGNAELNKKLVEKIQKGNPVTLLNKIWFDFLEKAYIDKQLEICDCQKDRFFNLIKKSTDGISGIYAEFKSGQPTTDQVFDAVYGKGAKNRLRVILYDGVTSDEDNGNTGADEIIVESFVDGMNSYGSNIFLVKVRLDKDGKLECETITGPDEIVEASEAKIPPEEVVRENEFWDLYYWSQYECFFFAHRCLAAGLGEHWKYGERVDENEFSWCVRWNESGIFYEIRNDSKEMDCLTIIWEKKKDEFQELFPGYKVTYEAKPGVPSKIFIYASDIKVGVLVSATISFKRDLAGKIKNEINNLGEFLQEYLCECENGKLKKVSEFRSLAEVC